MRHATIDKRLQTHVMMFEELKTLSLYYKGEVKLWCSTAAAALMMMMLMFDDAATAKKMVIGGICRMTFLYRNVTSL